MLLHITLECWYLFMLLLLLDRPTLVAISLSWYHLFLFCIWHLASTLSQTMAMERFLELMNMPVKIKNSEK